MLMVGFNAGRRFRRRTRNFRRGLVVCSVAFTLPQMSCYTYGATYQGQVVPGTRMAFALTDQGRAAMADQVGAGVLRIEGMLAENTATAYLVNVAAVRSIEGGRARWGGERIVLARDHVANVLRRDFSRGRTAMALGAVALGITAFIISRDLSVFGLFREDRPGRPPPPID